MALLFSSKAWVTNLLTYFDLALFCSFAVSFLKVLKAAVSSGLSCPVLSFFGQPIVKRFALCYRTVVQSVCLSCPVLSVSYMSCLQRWCIVAKRLDGSRWNLARRYRHQPRPHCIRWGPSSSSPKGAQPPIFGPCLFAAKRSPYTRPSQLLMSTCFSFRRPARTARPIFTLYGSHDVVPPKDGPLGGRTMSDILGDVRQKNTNK